MATRPAQRTGHWYLWSKNGGSLISLPSQDQGFQDDRNPPSYWFLACAILLAAAVIRLYDLDQHGLWYDEILTALRAQESLPWLVSSESLRSWPLLYLTTKLSFFFFGQSDFATRLPAVFAGVLGIACIYWAGASFFGRREGLIAALLLALSPLHVHASRDARYYAMAVLMCLITTIACWYAVNTGRKRYWAAFLLSTLLSLYNHPSALLVLAGQMVFLGLLWAGRLARRRDRGALSTPPVLYPFLCILALAGIATGYVVSLPGQMSANLLGQGSEPGSPVNLSLGFFAGLADALAGGPGLITAISVVAFLLGIVVSVRATRTASFLLLAILLAPVAMLPFLKLRISFVYKYLIFMLPIYLLFVSRGIESLFPLGSSTFDTSRVSRSWIAPLPGLLVLTVFAAYAGRSAVQQAGERTEEWREMGRFLEQNVQGSDAVVVAPMIGPMNAPSHAHVLYYYWPLAKDRIHSPDTMHDLCSQHRAVWTISTPPYTPVLDLSAEEGIGSLVRSFDFYPSFQVGYWACLAGW